MYNNQELDLGYFLWETVPQSIGRRWLPALTRPSSFMHRSSLATHTIVCLAVRAYQKTEELKQLLEIACSNYKQLGGITEEERVKKKEEREADK